jgi:hypothetical protein
MPSQPDDHDPQPDMRERKQEVGSSRTEISESVITVRDQDTQTVCAVWMLLEL